MYGTAVTVVDNGTAGFTDAATAFKADFET
jgi:hypothetical protein